MPYPNEHAARMVDPDRFVRFRRENDKFGPGIHAIWGVTSEGKVELQAIRFDAKKFTPDEARAWLKEHGHKPILFEPASGNAEGGRDVRNLLLTANVEIAAEGAGEDGASGKPEGHVRRFRILAYTGGPISVAGWTLPVVVDLDGLRLGRQRRPIMIAHGRQPEDVLGQTESIRVMDGNLIAEGRVIGVSERARQAVALHDAGFGWEASVGCEVANWRRIAEGEKITVNGREQSGPLALIEASRLVEISFVPLGADENTAAEIAASYVNEDKEKIMDEQEKQNGRQAAEPVIEKRVTANRGASRLDETILDLKRRQAIEDMTVAAIHTLQADRAATPEIADALRELCAKAQDEGRSVKDFELELMRAMRGSARPLVAAGLESPGTLLEAAALLSGGNRPEDVARECGPIAVDQAMRRFRGGVGLEELTLLAARANGYTGRMKITPGNWREVMGWACPQVRAAFSTVDLGGILGNVANKALAAVAQEPVWLVPKIAGRANHANFHAHTVYSLAVNGDMAAVAPTGELKHVSLGEESYTRQVSTRGAILSISRRDLINDDLGAFQRNAQALARKALTAREKALFALINASAAGSSHFTSSRGNYLTGTPFGLVGMGQAIKAFRNMTGPDGDPIMVEPSVVLVPSSLEAEARMLLAATSALIATALASTSAKSRDSNANIYAGRFGGAPLVSPWLENAALTGNSTAAWYLLADPAVYPCYEVAYLNGQESPVVEYFGLDASPDVLGVSWRVYYDFGVAAAEWRAGVKSAYA